MQVDDDDDGILRGPFALPVATCVVISQVQVGNPWYWGEASDALDWDRGDEIIYSGQRTDVYRSPEVLRKNKLANAAMFVSTVSVDMD